VTQILARYDARATFFLSGARASKNPDLIDVLVKAGHDVFGHGWIHVRYQTPDEVISNLEQVESLLRQHRPTPSPYLVRVPYGEGRRQQWMHRAIRQWNPTAQIADWTYWLEDWEIPPKCRNRSDLARVCRATVDKLLELPELDGAILLLHEEPYDVGSPLNSFVIPVLLEQLLDRLSQLGYSFVRMIPWMRQPLVTKFLLNSRLFRLAPR
jgi:peptidoglycan/xylan/chitin deacetylase (PgdA/CDA1 family)